MKKKVSAYWRSWKKLWNAYKIAKGKKDYRQMRKIEKNLVEVANKLEITPPVFLVMEVSKNIKRK